MAQLSALVSDLVRLDVLELQRSTPQLETQLRPARRRCHLSASTS